MANLSSIAVALMVCTASTLAGCAADGAGDAEEDVMGVSEDALSTSCTATQTKKFDIPRYEDIVVEAANCLQRSADGLYVRAKMTISWRRATGSGITIDHEFENFDLTPRLERSPDVVVTSARCDKTQTVSENSSGSASCYTGWRTRGSSRWSADGKIVYNIDNDGLGDHTWELTGSSYL